ncbi:MAG: AsnC family protein [Opitutaceae bacterium]|nr:AsnC family protein [Opitutaceae bacterium]
MVTKAQDILVALKLALGSARPSYADLGQSLGMSASEVHAAVRRLIEARLLDPESQQVRREALRNFLVHGVPYGFPASPKEVTRGMPTAWAAPVMAGKVSASEQIPPVWPDPEGNVQGAAVMPLYASVPSAARRDPELYHLLALVDALRLGRARERAFAEKELSERLSSHAAA